MRRRSGLAVLLVALAVPAGARAGDTPIEAASTLYDEGVKAQKRGDYPRAAQLFARADELVPDPAALEAAIGAAALADDPVLVMTLVQRSRRSGASGTLATTVRAARSKFGSRVGYVRVSCDGCRATVDGEPLAPAESRIVKVGAHTVVLQVAGSSERRRVQVDAGQHVDVEPGGHDDADRIDVDGADPRADRGEAPKPARDEGGGVSPGWFWVGTGLTLVAATFTIASGVDTLELHDEFLAKQTQQKADEGQAAESRTYGLLALTTGLAVGTAALGLFAVRWEPARGPSTGRPTASVALGPGRIVARVAF